MMGREHVAAVATLMADARDPRKSQVQQTIARGEAMMYLLNFVASMSQADVNTAQRMAKIVRDHR